MSIMEILEEAKSLSVDDRKLLIRLLMDTLDAVDASLQDHSILELGGLGREILEGINAQEYINQLRSEWDHRP